MSEPLRGVVVSHGAVGAALVDAVRSIAGHANGLAVITNEGCSRETLVERVADAVGDDPCVVFVDLPGGSCFRAAAHMTKDHPHITVVAGVNLPMLLDFVLHRDSGRDVAVSHSVEAGARAIQVVPR